MAARHRSGWFSTFETDQGIIVSVKVGPLGALNQLAVFEDVYLALMVGLPVCVFVQLTLQVEVVAPGTSVHGLPWPEDETVPFDTVKVAVPRGAPWGAPAVLFVTVAVQLVATLTC